MDKIQTDDIIIVEGKYDRIRLSEVVDGIILETDGFAVYSDRERRSLFRFLAETHYLIIMTDSDAAGFQIRSYLSSFLPAERLRHALIPDIYGKERRKAEASKEGKLGVEGMEAAVLREALLKAGINSVPGRMKDPVTVSDLFELGLTGRPNSAEKRRKLLSQLHFPARTSTRMLLDIVNATMTKEDFFSASQSVL